MISIESDLRGIAGVIDEMHEEENKAAIRRSTEAFNNGDLDGSSELYAPSLSAYLPASPGPLNYDAYKQAGKDWRNAFSDVKLTVEDQFAEEDKVATRFTVIGTHTKEFQGIPPTGKRFKITAIIIDRFDKSKVVERWSQFDLMGLMQQLGVTPEPTRK